MTHFLQIATGLDVLPLLLAVRRQPHLWNQHRVRTTFPGTPHDVNDILLRFQDLTPHATTGDTASIVDGHESLNFPAMAALPQARPLIFGLMARVEGERLGRCILTELLPGHQVAPHVDGGDHAAYYDRYLISLQCPPEALMRAEREIVHMEAGTCWWFNNGVEHEVWHDGQGDSRIVLIVDIRSTR